MHDLSFLVLLLGVVILLAMAMRVALERIGLPALLGYLALGVGMRALDTAWPFLTDRTEGVFHFLEGVGVVALLFRVGLESNPRNLLHQLPRASWIWVWNLLLSGVPAFAVAFWCVGLDMLPSLFAAVALTATSVGVSLAVWSEAGAVDSKNGSLLVDVAELDDISGVALMALLLALVPTLHGAGDLSWPALGEVAGWFGVKLVVFVGLCALFARYAEPRLTAAVRHVEGLPEPMHVVVATGIVIAAAAGLLGFSLAIGALFAGLVYGRDAEEVEQDSFYRTLYDIFSPFFFVGIGLKIEPSALGGGLGLGALFLAVAVLGKVVGTALPALMVTGRIGATLIGVSMVPRAEIALIVMQQGHSLGNWAVPPGLFAATLVISAATCLGVPPLLRHLLERWPQTGSDE